MTKAKILETLVNAVEHLRKAQPGWPSSERSAARAEANRLLETMPANWWRRLEGNELADALIDELGRIA